VQLYSNLQYQTCNPIFCVLLDVNDNPPEFTSKYYFATVAEGVPVGTDVVRLLATSRDIGVNAEISYAIVGGNEHRIFTIEPHSGLVSVAAGIDYERSRAFFLTVQARDGGEPPLTNRATVNITVLDVNDNAPVFGQMSYSAAVSESSEVGVGILSLTATDLDQVNPRPPLPSPFFRRTYIEQCCAVCFWVSWIRIH
jgi:protocadherin Fat 1/2/3